MWVVGFRKKIGDDIGMNMVDMVRWLRREILGTIAAKALEKIYRCKM